MFRTHFIFKNWPSSKVIKHCRRSSAATNLTLRMSRNDAIKMDFYSLHSIVVINGTWWGTITTSKTQVSFKFTLERLKQCCTFPIIPHLFILIAIFSCLFSSSRTFFTRTSAIKIKWERGRENEGVGIIEIESHVSVLSAYNEREEDELRDEKLKQNGTNDEAYIKHALNCIYALF